MGRIILEGPDRTGKTTLGLKMADRLGLGFYRKRALHGMRSETIRALSMNDCVVDRSWLTDVHYSKAKGRSPGSSRADLYRYGLIAARYAAAVFKLVPVRDPERDDPIDGTYERITQLYAQAHWTEPYQTYIFHPMVTDNDVEEMVVMYRRGAELVDRCPGSLPSFGSPGQCHLLLLWEYSDLLGDLLFQLGIMPRDVHICNPMPGEKDEIVDHFKGAVVIEPPKVRKFSVATYGDILTDVMRAIDDADVPRKACGLEAGVNIHDEDYV